MNDKKIFREFISLDEASSRLMEYLSSIQSKFETVPISEALGSAISKDIVSKFDVPPFDKALMDGYAVRAQDTFDAEEYCPVKLKLLGNSEMGEEPEFNVKKGTTVEISTGAPIPKGANSVVMLEYTKRKNDVIEIFRSVVPSENIIETGADIRTGEVILRKGQLIGAKEIGLLSAIGIDKVMVYKRPIIGIISTGDELIAPGDKFKNWKIFDINSSTLASSVIESGGKPINFGIVPDDIEKLRKIIKSSLKCCDLVLLSGSTSTGTRDYLGSLMNEIGKPGVLVPGIAIKPGKPTIVAGVKDKLIFCLPGNPTSALAIFHILVKPIISKISGKTGVLDVDYISGKIATRIHSAKGRLELLPVHILFDKKEDFIIYPTYGKSASISSFAMADGFLLIPENKVILEESEIFNVIPFNKNFMPAEMVFSGSHCLGLELIISMMRKIDPSIKVKSIYIGSIGGVKSIKRNESDIAGIHILDETSKKYNLPILKQFHMLDNVVLVRGYKRKQGYIVQNGNPKGIKSFEDLIKNNLVFINRNIGSGTRLLIDMNLKQMAEKLKISFKELTNNIDGYHIAAKSHSAVAAAIYQKKADVGIGIKTVAEIYGLDFIPIKNENYDFLIHKDSIQKKSVKIFLDILRSEEFKNSLSRVYPGLIPEKNTGKFISK
jgi:putative molybdopterin biosynthesis protein